MISTIRIPLTLNEIRDNDDVCLVELVSDVVGEDVDIVSEKIVGIDGDKVIIEFTVESSI